MDTKTFFSLCGATMVFTLLAQPLFAQEDSGVQNETAKQNQTMTQAQSQDRIYGSQLMTPQERNEYQNKMRQMNTEQERAELRAQHHEQMKQRAMEQGKTLPDDVPGNAVMQGKGKGHGMSGQDPSKGMGQGSQSMGGAGKGSSGGKGK